MSKILDLHRFACHPAIGTFGTLEVDGMTLFTVERPWHNNERMISCIPPGSYGLKSRKFYRGGYNAIEVTGVEDRSYILFHKANHMNHLAGCIAVGMELGMVDGLWAVTNSAGAFAHLMGAFEAHAYDTLVVWSSRN